MTTTGDTRSRQILDAAATCLAQRGFHRATMQDICKQVSLSPGSVYRYFRSKDDIIAALIDEERGRAALLLDTLSRANDLVEGFRNLLTVVFATLDDPRAHALHVEVTAEALRNPAVRDRVHRRDPCPPGRTRRSTHARAGRSAGCATTSEPKSTAKQTG